MQQSFDSASPRGTLINRLLKERYIQNCPVLEIFLVCAKWRLCIVSFDNDLLSYFVPSPAPLKLDETILLSSDTDENFEFIDVGTEKQR